MLKTGSFLFSSILAKIPVANSVHTKILGRPGNYTVKKRLAIFPSPAGMSLTKLSKAGNNLIFPANFFYSNAPKVLNLRAAQSFVGYREVYQ